MATGIEKAEAELFQRVVSLESEVRHMIKELERNQAECEQRVEAMRKVIDHQQDSIDAHTARLGAYDRMAIKGGSFALGFLALGVLMSESVANAVKRVLAFLP